MLLTASAIYELIETLVWESFSMLLRVCLSFSFSFGGNFRVESSSLAPTYSIRSWTISPIRSRESHLI